MGIQTVRIDTMYPTIWATAQPVTSYKHSANGNTMARFSIFNNQYSFTDTERLRIALRRYGTWPFWRKNALTNRWVLKTHRHSTESDRAVERCQLILN